MIFDNLLDSPLLNTPANLYLVEEIYVTRQNFVCWSRIAEISYSKTFFIEMYANSTVENTSFVENICEFLNKWRFSLLGFERFL